MKNILHTIFLLFFALSALQAKATTLTYSGISFSGDAGGTGQNSIAKRFPYTYNLYNLKDSQNPNLSRLNKILSDKLRKNYKGHYPLELENLVRAKDDVLSLAFVMNFEKVSVGKSEMKNIYRTEILVGADALIFDFKTKKIVASYPIMVSYTSLNEKKLSSQEIFNIFAKIFGENAFDNNEERININIFDLFVEKLNKANIANSQNLCIGVKNVIIGNEAKSNLLKCNLGDLEGSKKILSNMFNAQISKNFNVSIMPYTHNSVLFVNMAQSYMESSDLLQITLELPKPTYELTLNFGKLIGVPLKDEDRIRLYFFGGNVYVGANVQGQPMKINKKFKKGFSNTYIIGQEHNWDFSAEYMRALLMLMQTVPQELINNKENKELLKIFK